MNPLRNALHHQSWPLLLAVVMFALVLGSVTLSLRDELRGEMLQRDAVTLAAVNEMLMQEVARDYAEVGLELTPAELAPEVAVMAAAMRGVVAVSLHGPDGQVQWRIPDDFAPPAAAHSDINAATHDAPLATFHPHPTTARASAAPDDSRLVEINVPTGPNGRPGYVSFWVSGTPTAAAFADLDRRLLLQAGGAWLLGSVLFLGGGTYLQRRLARRQAQLVARTRELETAHRDLDLQARSTAIGAVAGTLIHDLRNQLGTLQLALHGKELREQARHAVTATERMERLINEVVTILRDQEGVSALPYGGEELVDALRDACDHDERLQWETETPFEVPGQQGGLVLLALKQLVTNALRATAPDGRVIVRASRQGRAITLTVSDDGPGLPEAVRASLFAPKATGTAHGVGLGLLLARQLVASFGGTLLLVNSDATGTTFALTLPDPVKPLSEPARPDEPDALALLAARHPADVCPN